jgi:hypothetical protein
MKKNIVTIFLLAFVLAALGFWGVKSYVDSQKEDSQISKVRTVYYFHGNKRCRTCNNMENYTKTAIKSSWPKLIKDGTLVVLSVNVDKAENEHFVKEFDLKSKVVVLTVPDKNGKIKFKKLTEVWTHVRSKEKFINYIKTGTKEFFNLGKKLN